LSKGKRRNGEATRLYEDASQKYNSRASEATKKETAFQDKGEARAVGKRSGQ